MVRRIAGVGRMSLRFRIVAAVVAGLGVGLGGAALLWPEPGRGARMVELFETHCVPFARTRATPDTAGLEQMADVPGQNLWVEKSSGIALEFDNHACQVSDVLGHVPADDHALIDAAVGDLILRAFPDLEPRDSDYALDWDRHLVWMQYPEDDPRNWAVQMFRVTAAGPDAATTLRVAFTPG